MVVLVLLSPKRPGRICNKDAIRFPKKDILRNSSLILRSIQVDTVVPSCELQSIFVRT